MVGAGAQNSKLCHFDYCFFGLRFGFSTFISFTFTINGITPTGGGTEGAVAVLEDMNTKKILTTKTTKTFVTSYKYINISHSAFFCFH